MTEIPTDSSQEISDLSPVERQSATEDKARMEELIFNNPIIKNNIGIRLHEYSQLLLDNTDNRLHSNLVIANPNQISIQKETMGTETNEAIRKGHLNLKGQNDHPIPVLISSYVAESGEYVCQLSYDWVSINRMIPDEVEMVSLHELENSLEIGLKLTKMDILFKTIVRKSEESQTDDDALRWRGVTSALDPLTLVTEKDLTPEQFSDTISQVTRGSLVLDISKKSKSLKGKIGSLFRK